MFEAGKAALREGGFDKKKKLKINIVFKSRSIHFPLHETQKVELFCYNGLFFMLGDIFGFFII